MVNVKLRFGPKLNVHILEKPTGSLGSGQISRDFPAGLRRVQTGSPGPSAWPELPRGRLEQSKSLALRAPRSAQARAGLGSHRAPGRGSQAPARGSRPSGQRQAGWGYSPGRGWPCQAGTFHSGPASSPLSAPRRDSRRDFPESVSVQGVEME